MLVPPTFSLTIWPLVHWCNSGIRSAGNPHVRSVCLNHPAFQPSALRPGRVKIERSTEIKWSFWHNLVQQQYVAKNGGYRWHVRDKIVDSHQLQGKTRFHGVYITQVHKE